MSSEPVNSDRAAPSDTIASCIRETEARRKTAEIQLRRVATGEGLTADEIREVVEKMTDIITADLNNGAIVTLSRNRNRIKHLPITWA